MPLEQNSKTRIEMITFPFALDNDQNSIVDAVKIHFESPTYNNSEKKKQQQQLKQS